MSNFLDKFKETYAVLEKNVNEVKIKETLVKALKIRNQEMKLELTGSCGLMIARKGGDNQPLMLLEIITTKIFKVLVDELNTFCNYDNDTSFKNCLPEIQELALNKLTNEVLKLKINTDYIVVMHLSCDLNSPINLYFTLNEFKNKKFGEFIFVHNFSFKGDCGEK